MKLINMTEAAILTALVSQDLYGLKLIERVRQISNGKIRLSLGSVYPTLYRMENKKLITAYWGDDSETRAGARRRYYQVTGLGARALNEVKSILIPIPAVVGGAYD